MKDACKVRLFTSFLSCCCNLGESKKQLQVVLYVGKHRIHTCRHR
jgi:hypothetical protein